VKLIGAEMMKTPFEAPIANAFAESWIGHLKRGCLNHFWCFSLRHLDHIVQAYARYHNRFRPHQSLENTPPEDVTSRRRHRWARFVEGVYSAGFSTITTGKLHDSRVKRAEPYILDRLRRWTRSASSNTGY
jgi:hypothetical protein